jgi:transcriptional antiterminator NusG
VTAALDPSNAPAWYLVRVSSNKEDSVRRDLERKIQLRGLGDRIVEVKVPTEKSRKSRTARSARALQKTYPGYVLVNMLMDDKTWAFVRETRSVPAASVGGGGNVRSTLARFRSPSRFRRTKC